MAIFLLIRGFTHIAGYLVVEYNVLDLTIINLLMVFYSLAEYLIVFVTMVSIKMSLQVLDDNHKYHNSKSRSNEHKFHSYQNGYTAQSSHDFESRQSSMSINQESLFHDSVPNESLIKMHTFKLMDERADSMYNFKPRQMATQKNQAINK